MNDLRLKNLSLLIKKYGTVANLVRTFDGLDASYISTLLKGRRSFGERAVRNMEHRCNLPDGWFDVLHDEEGSLDNNIETTPIPASYVPLISWVSAGQWRAAIDDRETYDHVQCPVTAHGKGTFALEVRGVSMYNPKGKDSFAEKDIIFVDPSRDANSGDYVVAMHTDQYQATFKQLFCEDGRKFLKALNPDWQPNIQEINQDTILVGVVIAKVTTQVFK